MFNGSKVIDADGHVMEPNELYDQYLESKFKPDLEELKKIAATRGSKYFFGFFHQLNTGRPLGIAELGKPLFRSGRKPQGESPDPRGGFDPHLRIKDMDREGIDIAVVFATIVSSFCALKSVDFEVAMIRAYHRWLADYCAAYPNRIKGVAVVPMRVAERAAEEIHRASKERWCVGVYLSGHMEDKLLDHPAFHPIWQACIDEDLPACFHGGTARPPYGAGTFEMGDNLFIQHSATNPFEIMRAIAALVGGGVLEIFPKLRVAFLEAGVGWLPYWMERLDEHYELMPEYVPFLKRKPSEVIRSENFFISCDPDEETLPYVVDKVGAGRILYASDYPHFDGRFPNTVKFTAGRKEFSPAVQRNILHENPTRLYTRLR
ncbi:MAG TPA: amidohydrolase family protein [Candidatus Binataceae bacterium]